MERAGLHYDICVHWNLVTMTLISGLSQEMRRCCKHSHTLLQDILQTCLCATSLKRLRFSRSRLPADEEDDLECGRDGAVGVTIKL